VQRQARRRRRSDDDTPGARRGPDHSHRATPFDFSEATDAQFEALNRLLNDLRAERQPDDPPTPLSVTVHRCRNFPSFVEAHAWAVTSDDGERMLAFGVVYLPLAPENGHLAEISLDVRADHRRQGIGRNLLAHCVDVAASRDRRLLVAATSGRIPAGEAFMLRLGATRGVMAQTHQLDLTRLDRGLVTAWLDAGRRHERTYEIGFWDGPYPDDELAAIAALHDVMNQQPRDQLDVNDERMTPERLREVERFFLTEHTTRWTIFLRARATGAFVGFTDIGHDTQRPELAQQGNTGVFPEHRGRGLGRWLKAAMLQRLLDERPEVRLIRTTNADSNAAMRRINEELGFVSYSSECVWQVATRDVESYLRSRVTGPGHPRRDAAV
jgi:mycothiol synthase